MRKPIDPRFDQLLVHPSPADLSTKTAAELEPLPLLRVNWQPGNSCVYDCSYCNPKTKDGSRPWPDVERTRSLISLIQDVYSKPPYDKTVFRYEWIGGEPTVWKDIELVLGHVSDLGGSSEIVTNASRSVRWWRENARHFSAVTCSYHVESADLRHFTSVCNTIADAGVSCGVVVMMLPSRWDECVAVFDHLRRNGRFGMVSPNIIYDLGTPSPWHSYPYTEAQLAWFSDTGSATPDHSVDLPDARHWVPVLRDSLSGEAVWSNTETMVNTNTNNFLGWDCYIGIDTLHINSDGEVLSDVGCMQGQRIGNWLHDDLSTLRWPVNTTLCMIDDCWCANDLRARKTRGAGKLSF